MNPTRQKLMILCVGAAFFLLACQGVDYRQEYSTQETIPGKAGTDHVAASVGGAPPSAAEGRGTPPAAVDSGALTLPATFKATLPCADCGGILYFRIDFK
jgi:hypothetical protein